MRAAKETLVLSDEAFKDLIAYVQLRVASILSKWAARMTRQVTGDWRS